MQEAFLWSKERNGIRCYLCARNCFISKDKRGYCVVRMNKGNQLFTLNHGKLTNLEVRNIEKNPLFHFLPMSKSLAISSQGCNLKCEFSCSHPINKDLASKVEGKEYSPEDVLKMAEKNNCKSITYAGDEPFMFLEFIHKLAKMANRNNICNNFVTNGYTTVDAVKKISKFMDAATVVIRASADNDFYDKYMDIKDTSPIFRAIKQMKKQRTHTEIANIIIPQLGDNAETCKNLAEWINSELSPEAPFHLMQFQPSHSLSEIPVTPIATLEKCAEEARKAGLRYVYIHTTPSHSYENTYCYNCGEMLVKRKNRAVEKINLSKDRCRNCGFKTHLRLHG